MAETVLVQHLRDELGKARVLADPRNYEEVMQLRSEVMQLRAQEAEFERIVDKVTREKDLARSSVAALDARFKAEAANQTFRISDLEEHLQRAELVAARMSVAKVEALRQLHVERKLSRDNRMKVLTLECRLEILLAEKISSLEKTHERTDATERVQAEAVPVAEHKGPRLGEAVSTTGSSNPTEVKTLPLKQAVKGSASVLSPAFESKVQSKIRPEVASKAARKSNSSVASDFLSRASVGSQGKRSRSSVSMDDDEEESDEDQAYEANTSKLSSSSSKKKAKPRYSLSKGRPSHDAFAAFDLTKRLAAPKLKATSS